MHDATHKLISQTIHRFRPSALAEPELATPQLRVGFWPVQSKTSPETAMGLMAVLGNLLERWQDIAVYRLMAQLDEEEWTIEQSQFGVDDWQLDGLGENVAIWGEFSRSGARCQLSLDIENDQTDDEAEVEHLEYNAPGLWELVGMLPQIAGDVAAHLDAVTLNLISPAYKLDVGNSAAVETLLKRVFDWERRLYFLAAEEDWPNEEMDSDHQALLDASRELGEFGAWLISEETARAMSPVFEPVNAYLIESATRIVEAFESSLPAVFLAPALHQLEHSKEAYDLLEDDLEIRPESADGWLTLAELHRRDDRPAEAADLLQEAIESKAANSAVNFYYGNLLLSFHQQGLEMKTYVYIDPDEIKGDMVLWEAVEAYQMILNQDTGNLDALHRQLMTLVNLDSPKRFWQDFERLVALDPTGDRVRNLAEACYALDDVSPGIKILSEAAAKQPDRPDLLLSQAVLCLTGEAYDAAQAALEKADSLTDDPAVRADIDRLLLAANDPEFDETMGAITDAVNSGKPLEDEDVDYLESILEDAPGYTEVYLLLGRAYLSMRDSGAALETLLDGQRELPDDPDICEMLVRVLREAGEDELALENLDVGLSKNPNHVPLLSLAGLYLFEDGQEEVARNYLARAEAIAPRHPTLIQAKAAIARMISSEN